MNKRIIYSILLLSTLLMSEELQVRAKSFTADEKIGKSVFQGDVNIRKGEDELNASKISIFTDSSHKPIKYIANGNVSFYINTNNGSIYSGKAQKVIYLPKKKEYRFFQDVTLSQLNEKKVIIGNEVVLQVIDGKAYAKGQKDKPVIMIFDISDKKGKIKND